AHGPGAVRVQPVEAAGDDDFPVAGPFGAALPSAIARLFSTAIGPQAEAVVAGLDLDDVRPDVPEVGAEIGGLVATRSVAQLEGRGIPASVVVGRLGVTVGGVGDDVGVGLRPRGFGTVGGANIANAGLRAFTVAVRPLATERGDRRIPGDRTVDTLRPVIH